MKTKILFLVSLFIGLTIRLSAQNNDTFMTSNKGCKVLCSNCPSEVVSVSWDGKCVNGYASGYGTRIFYYSDQTKAIYIGSMVSGKREGKGKYIGGIDNSKYEGGWVNNKMEGYGIYLDANGNKYEGGFLKNLYDGQGSTTFSDGFKFIGSHKNGFATKGKRYYPSGKLQLVGNWNKNDFINGTWYYEDGSIYATYSNGVGKLSKIAQLKTENQELKSKSYESSSNDNKSSSSSSSSSNDCKIYCWFHKVDEDSMEETYYAEFRSVNSISSGYRIGDNLRVEYDKKDGRWRADFSDSESSYSNANDLLNDAFYKKFKKISSCSYWQYYEK